MEARRRSIDLAGHRQEEGFGASRQIPTTPHFTDTRTLPLLASGEYSTFGEAKGKTPLILQMKRGEIHQVEWSLEGYSKASAELDLNTQEPYTMLKETLKKAD